MKANRKKHTNIKSITKYLKKNIKRVIQIVAVVCALITAVSIRAFRHKNIAVSNNNVNVTSTTVDNKNISQSNSQDKESSTDKESSESKSDEDPASQESTSDAVIKIVTDESLESTSAKQLSKTEQEWKNKLIPKVSDYLVVREKPDQDSQMIGKLYQGNAAEVLENVNGWSKIKSGDVEGYVNTEYALTGMEAYEYAKTIVNIKAKNVTDGLRVRKDASTDSDIVELVENGANLIVNKDAKEVEGWIAVRHGDVTGYVSKDFVELSLETGVGITIKEENARLEAERLAKEAAEKASREAAEYAAKENAKKASREAAQKAEALAKEKGTKDTKTAKDTKAAKSKTTSSGGSISTKAGDLDMLAAIIECEAGSESYESKLAVGAVVVNRVQSSQFPNSISDVLYQGGQFTPVATGNFERVLARGAHESCYQAARDALAGSDNTGGCLYFRTANGRPGLVIENMVFY
jgi:cell wall hydrolase./bacterial SH3 domain